MHINAFNRSTNYIKAGTLALLVSLAGCTKQKAPVVLKDVVEFSHPTTAKLLESLENGHRHSATVFLDSPAKRVVTKEAMDTFKIVPDTLLEKLKTLPDTMEVYFQVYKGKADDAIQKARGNKQNLVTVGHGMTGRDSIALAGNQKAGLGDYVSQYVADSLFNRAINQKDSILRANIAEDTYKRLETYEKDAILSYLYNVNENLLKKYNAKRPIKESFFQCLDSAEMGKVQAKFNVTPSAKQAVCGLAKRNLIQMLVFGNGKVYSDKFAQENFYKNLSVIKKRKDAKLLMKEVFDILRKYGVDETNLAETQNKVNKYMHFS